MKKFYTILFFATLNFANAQLPNPSFEQLMNWGQSSSNWGSINPMMLSIAVIDSTNTTPVEEPIPDSIIFQEGVFDYTFPSEDAYDGFQAMKLKNAFNRTRNIPVMGKLFVFGNIENTLNPLGNGSGIPIEQGTIIDGLGFYYKFSPLNNETAYAKLELYDENGQSVGKTTIDIREVQSNYIYVSAPIEITSVEQAVFLTIEFGMNGGNSIETINSQLLIDNVKVNNLALKNNSFSLSPFKIYPTITNSKINIITDNSNENGNHKIDIVNTNGEIVSQFTLELIDNSPISIDVSNLSSGIYFIKSKASITKFVKL